MGSTPKTPAPRPEAQPATPRGSVMDAHIPVWRRLTALFSLGSVVIIIGVLIAALITATALLALFILDRAIAG